MYLCDATLTTITKHDLQKSLDEKKKKKINEALSDVFDFNTTV